MARSIDQAVMAQGSLRDTPFCHLLLDARRREISGTLLLIAAASGEVQIRLQRGRANKALLATEASDLLHALLPLCLLDQGSFVLYEDVDLLTGVPDAISGHVDAYALLAASLAAHVRDDVVDNVLSRFRNQTLRLPPRRDVGWLRLDKQAGVLVELIRAAPTTAEELIAQTPLPEGRTRRLLYGLLVTKTLIPYEQASQTSQDLQRSQPVPTAAPSVPSRPSSRSAPAWQALASLRPRVVSRVSSLDPGAPSIPTSATPPSSPRPSIAVTQRPSGKVPVVPPAATIAADDIPARIKRAEQLSRRGQHDEAVAEVNALLQLEPNRAELHGLCGLVLFEKHSKDPSGLPRRLLDALKKALWLDQEETYALYTRGLICKRGGDPARALTHFKKVLEIDPDHPEAQREMRLAQLRGTKEVAG